MPGSLSLQAFREINKIKITWEEEGSAEKKSVEGYTPGGLDMNLTADFADVATGNGVSNMMSGLINLMGCVPALDYPRKFLYKGTKPVSFTIPVYFVLEKSPSEDYLKKLKALLGMFLPTQAKSLHEAMDKGDQTTGANLDAVVACLGDAMSWIVEGLGNFLGSNIGTNINKTIESTREQMRYLKLPPMLAAGSEGVTVDIGMFHMPNLLIRSIGIQIPKMMYGDGYPAYVKLTITFETLRVASTNMFQNIFK